MSQIIAMGMTRISVEDLQCGKLQRLHGLWSKLRGERSLPQRQDFLPEQLEFILGRVNLVEVLRAEKNFRYRLLGTQIEDAGRRGDQGKTLDRIGLRAFGELLSDAYCEVLSDGRPVCRRVEYRNRDMEVWFEQLILPFALEGMEVELLLEAIDWPLGMIQNFRNLAHVEPCRQAS